MVNNWIHNNGLDDYAYYYGGAGIYFENQIGIPKVWNNTLYDNYTYGIQSSQSGADPNIRNCIIKENGTADLYRPNGSFNKVNYCLLQNYPLGTTNITGDPGFINISTNPDDLHISESSICKDAGDPSGNYDGQKDIDGEDRVKYGRVDIGADEYYWSPADFDESGFVNLKDYAAIAAAWNEPNSTVNLSGTSTIDIYDVNMFCKDWLWKKAWDDGWMMCMAGGGEFGLESMSLLESSLSLDSGIASVPSKERSDQLMLSNSKSLKLMPPGLAEKCRIFYDITPETTISARQKLLDSMDVRISSKQVLNLLDEIWQSGSLKVSLSEEQYLKFRKAVENNYKF